MYSAFYHDSKRTNKARFNIQISGRDVKLTSGSHKIVNYITARSPEHVSEADIGATLTPSLKV
jgi:hypothetical protein